MLEQIGEIDVEFSTILGRTTVTLDDFLQFREGDIVQLSQFEGDDLEILVENQPLLKGQPGTVGQHLAVQITKWMDREEVKSGG